MDAGAEVTVELALAGEMIAGALAGAALGTINGLVLMGALIGPLMLGP